MSKRVLSSGETQSTDSSLRLTPLLRAVRPARQYTLKGYLKVG